MQKVSYRDLGRMDYQAAWDYQTSLHRRLIDNKLINRELKPGAYPQEHSLLFVEHPPVYTLGKSGSPENLLLTENELQARGIQFFPINRGGDITFHGPGQIVGYPILDLECFFTDVHKYVRNIEEVVIRTLAEYGLEAVRIKDYTGVWCPPRVGEGVALPGLVDNETRVTDLSVSEDKNRFGSFTFSSGKERDALSPPGGAEGAFRGIESSINEARASDARPPSGGPGGAWRKICAIGVHLSRWVTLHGWAFNINTPLEYFDYIVPCGITDEDKTVTSLAAELGRPVDEDEVKEKLKRHFAAIFECDIVDQAIQGQSVENAANLYYHNPSK